MSDGSPALTGDIHDAFPRSDRGTRTDSGKIDKGSPCRSFPNSRSGTAPSETPFPAPSILPLAQFLLLTPRPARLE
jgi:hypothetical protein